MKKIYNLLLMVVLFTIAGGAQAKYWEYDDDAYVTQTPEAGTPYLLVKGSEGDQYSTQYLSHSGSIVNAFANDDQVWYFEQTGEGWRIYYVDADNVKHYIANRNGQAYGFTTTERFAATRMGVWAIAPAQYMSKEDLEAGIDVPDYYVTSTTNAQGNEVEPQNVDESEQILLADIALLEDGEKTTYLRYGGFGTAATENYWYLEPARQLGAESYRSVIETKLFGEHGFDKDLYKVGTDPGQYSPEALDALEEAYEEFSAAETPEDLERLGEIVLEAYNYMQTTYVPFGEGYFVLQTWRTSNNLDGKQGVLFDSYNTGVREDNAILVSYTVRRDGDENTGASAQVELFNVYQPSDLDEDGNESWLTNGAAPYFVWEVIKSTTEENRYYFRNYATGRYIGAPGPEAKSNVIITTTEEPVASYNMEPAAGVTDDDGNIYWRLYSDDLTKKSAWSGSWDMGGLHPGADVVTLVTWDSSVDRSCWYPRTVTDEMLDIIKGVNSSQEFLNTQLENLVEQAETTIEDNKTNGTMENGIANSAIKTFTVSPVEGLVTTKDQISSNASDSAEGKDLGFLLDGKPATMWHSNWHAGADPTDGFQHSIDFDLGKTVAEVTVKMASRMGQFNGIPTHFNAYGSNDGETWEPIAVTYNDTIPATEETEEIVEEKGGIDVTWFDTKVFNYEGAEANAYFGYLTTKVGYRHLRLELVHAGQAWVEFLDANNKDLTGSASMPYFNLSEVRVLEGAHIYTIGYDAANSKYEAVSQETRDELEGLITQGKTEVEAEKATQETIDALQAALNSFKEQLPDPDAVRQALQEARAFQQAVEENELIGSGIGYFQNGADAELKAVLDRINITATSSVAECQNALEIIQKALADFNSKLNKPVAGKYYYFACATEAAKQSLEDWELNHQDDENYEATLKARQEAFAASAYRALVGTRNANHFNLGWGDKDIASSDIKYRPGYIWKLEANEDGTYSFVHVLTGKYLAINGTVASGREIVLRGLSDMAAIEDSIRTTNEARLDSVKARVTFQSAKVAGVINIVFGNHVYANAQPGAGRNFVTWNAAESLDNSAFRFYETIAPQEGGDVFIELNAGKSYRVMTLPFNATPAEDMEAYDVLGGSTKDGAGYIELKKRTTEIPAGTPFVLRIPEAEEDELPIAVFEGWSMPTEEVADSVNVNGCVGVQKHYWIKNEGYVILKGYSKWFNDYAVYAPYNVKVEAGNGYFSELTSVGYGVGDARIQCPDGLAYEVEEGIQTITTSNNAVMTGTFNLMGQKVAGKLPAGLYIINGQKVLVK